MRRAIALRQQQAWRPEPEIGMTACQLAGIALGALVLGIVLTQVPDLVRYFRISNM